MTKMHLAPFSALREPPGEDAPAYGTPLLPGWYTLDAKAPQLLGARCRACGTYYFPKQVTFCRNPACNGEAFEEVALSRTGKLWSWTNACYAPPEPFVAPEPYEPFAIAAVELAKEKMIVLGAVVQGVTVAQLRGGMQMELALEPLADGKLTWKWRPAEESAAEGRAATPLPQRGRGEGRSRSDRRGEGS